jgi:hypothetical protein
MSLVNSDHCVVLEQVMVVAIRAVLPTVLNFLEQVRTLFGVDHGGGDARRLPWSCGGPSHRHLLL